MFIRHKNRESRGPGSN